MVEKDQNAYQDFADLISSKNVKEEIESNISKKSFYGLTSIQERYHAKEALKDFYSFNDGYAFVTFSYSDEARIAMLFSNYTMIGDNFIDVHLKNDLDHGDFDVGYV